MKVTKDLTVGNIWRNFILYTLPLIGSAVLSSAYSTVDAMIAGKFISEHALGAINATASFEMIFSSLFFGFSAGFSVYVAMLFGQRNYVAIKRDVVQTIIFSLGMILLVSVAAILLRAPVFSYLKVDPVLRADAELYFVIYTAGWVIVFINLLLVQILHALGVTSFSLYVSLLSAVLNIGGNLLTVLVFKMGVAGLAISTLLSALCATLIYLRLLRVAFREMVCGRVSYRFSFSCVRRSLRYTLPAALQQLSYHGVGFLVSPSINGLGADATSGYTVANRINSLCSNTFWSTAGALGCHTSQCVGAGKTKKIPKGLWVDLCISVAFLLPVMLAFIAFAEPIASIFFPDGYRGAAFGYAVRFATAYLPFLFVNMLGHLLHGYIRSLGAVSVVLGVSLLGSATRLTLTLILTPIMGMEGVFLAWICGWGADTGASAILYLLRYRTHRHILRVVLGDEQKKSEKGLDSADAS